MVRMRSVVRAVQRVHCRALAPIRAVCLPQQRRHAHVVRAPLASRDATAAVVRLLPARGVRALVVFAEETPGYIHAGLGTGWVESAGVVAALV